MSFAEARIREWRKAASSADVPRTKVRFAEVGSEEVLMAMISGRSHLREVREASEDEIEQQLAVEGLIRAPQVRRRPVGDFKRIDVGGKPISEVIIEERR